MGKIHKNKFIKYICIYPDLDYIYKQENSFYPNQIETSVAFRIIDMQSLVMFDSIFDFHFYFYYRTHYWN